MKEIAEAATMRNPAFWVCLSLSITLIIAGFIVPPLGDINGSVLTAVGLLFAFATLYEVHIAMKKGIDAKLRHGNTELAVGDFDNADALVDDNEIIND